MSALLIPCYRILMLDIGISLKVIAVLTLLNLSRMVRPGGRGRGGNDPPLPPDYMATMTQQFQQNQVFMQGVIDQLQNQNQNNNQNHQHGVDLQGFMRLSPLPSTTLSSHWKPMIGSVMSLASWSLLA